MTVLAVGCASVAGPVTTLHYGVAIVVEVVADKQVRRIHAAPVVAAMADDLASGYLSIRKLVGESVGAENFSGYREVPITRAHDRAGPSPARVRFLYKTPEILRSVFPHIQTS